MQFSAIFFTLLLSIAVAAQGNKTTKATSDKSLCHQMAKLESTVALAANATKLAAKEHNNVTKIAEFQAKASTAATELAAMSSNTTLVATCAVIASAEQTKQECHQMTAMEAMIALAANTTKLAAKEKNNATKIAAFQAKASEASVKLATMTSNTTLVSMCSSIKATEESSGGKKGKGNSTSTTGAAAASSSSQASATPSTTSGSNILSAQAGVLSTIFLVGAAMFML